jgi:superfamily I DNA/RNA helicase
MKVDVRTFHSLGLSLWKGLWKFKVRKEEMDLWRNVGGGRCVDGGDEVKKRYSGIGGIRRGGVGDASVRVVQDKTFKILFQNRFEGVTHYNMLEFEKLVSLAKTNLMMVGKSPAKNIRGYSVASEAWLHDRKEYSMDDSDESFMELRRLYGVYPMGFNLSELNQWQWNKLKMQHKTARRVLKKSAEMAWGYQNSIAGEHGRDTTSVIDYDDMLYLPSTSKGIVRPQYDYVFVDEAQDLSEARVKCLRLVCGPETKLVMFGDPLQNIYQVRVF